MTLPTTFSCECPKCGHERIQTSYTREELIQLLRSGAEIEVYCASCDAYWAASTEERADLDRSLTRR